MSCAAAPRSPAATWRPLGGEPSGAADAQGGGLGQCRGRRGRRRPRAGAAAATPPAGPGRGCRSRWRAPSPSGSSASTRSASRRASSARPLDSSGASAFHALPAASRPPTRDGTRLLASHAPTSTRPALGRGLRGPEVEVVGRQPDRRSSRSRSPSAISPAARAISTIRAAPGASTCSSRATALRSRTASPPLRSTAGGRHAPLVEQQLHASYDVEGGAGRGAGDQRGIALGRGEVGRAADGLGRRAAAAQGQADLARQHHGVAVAGDEQPAGDELLDGAGGLRGRDGAPRRAGGALAAVGIDVAQQGGRRRAELGE